MVVSVSLYKVSDGYLFRLLFMLDLGVMFGGIDCIFVVGFCFLL